LNIEVRVESWEAGIMFDVKEMQPRYTGGGMLINDLLQLLDERRACFDTLVVNSDKFIGILQTDSVLNYILSSIAKQLDSPNDSTPLSALLRSKHALNAYTGPLGRFLM
jgi:hypothetical protein